MALSAHRGQWEWVVTRLRCCILEEGRNRLAISDMLSNAKRGYELASSNRCQREDQPIKNLLNRDYPRYELL